MFRNVIALFICVAAIVPAFSQEGNYDWSTAETFAPGVAHAQMTAAEPRPARLHAARIDTKAPGLRFVGTPRCADWKANAEETVREPTRDFVREQNAAGVPMVLAINADAFAPWPAPWHMATRTNLCGLAVSDGVVVSPPSDEPSFVAYTDGHMALIEDARSVDISAVATAVSGFGFCLRHGEPLESGDDLAPRTGIGLSEDTRYVLLVTIDGRRHESQGATTHELGAWLKYFGASDGINLDGGGSTTMVRWNPAKPEGERTEVLNSPVGDGINWLEKPEAAEKSFAHPTERFNGNHLGVAVAAATPVLPSPLPYRDLGYVVVSPNGPADGGDFGPGTPGTKTSGIQEALNHAREINSDVYIVGGGAKEAFKNPVVYPMTETLRVPWMQDFKLEGGNAVIQYVGTGDAIVFDSQMSSWFKFGLVCNSGPGAVVRLRPETKGPDNFTVITACKFEFAAIVGAGSVFGSPDAKPRGTGLWCDSELGPVDGNEFHIAETIACETGIRLDEGSTNNWIRCPFLHLCTTHLVVGAPNSTRARLNRVEAFIDAGSVAESTGALVYGQNNLFTLSFGATGDKRNVVLGAVAANNLLTLMNVPNGITDDSGGKNKIAMPE